MKSDKSEKPKMKQRRESKLKQTTFKLRELAELASENDGELF